MALVLPVLFLMTFGCIEFGRAVMICNVLTSAAREGARSGVLPNGANSNVTAAVTEELAAHQLSTASATITVRVDGTVADAATADTGDRISVTVTMPYSAVSWLPTPLRLGSHQLTGIAVMRRE
jgi:Flp pilus assembly protein TadG